MSRAFLFTLIIAFACVSGLTFLAVSNPDFAIPLVASAFCVTILIGRSRETYRVLCVAISIVLILTSSSWIIEGTALASVVTRCLGGLGLIFLALSAVEKAKDRSRPRGWQWSVVLPLACFIFLSTVAHGLFREAAGYLLGLFVFGAIVFAVPRIALSELVRGLVFAFGALLSSSLLLGLVNPQNAIEGVRLRGFFENANTLGFVAFLSVAFALYVHGSIGVRVSILLAALTCLVLTGSRASTLSVLIVFGGWVLSRSRVLGTTILVLGIVVGIQSMDVLSSWSPQLDLLFRDTNSRFSSLVVAISDWQSNALLGVGLNQESAIIASSLLRALAQGGILGFLSILVMSISIVSVSFRANAFAAWFAVGAIVHSLFEGWLLSPTAPLLIVFFVLWFVLLEGNTVPKDGGLPDERTANGPTRKWISAS